MARGSFWISLVVSTVMWFIGDWLGDVFWPNDWVSSFAFAAIFAVLGGGVVMLMLNVRRNKRRISGRW